MMIHTYKMADAGLKLSTNFTAGEFACKCGCAPWKVSEDLVAKLQTLRINIGKPLKINSGYRCKTNNERANGAKNSQHLYGTAADIAIPTGLTNVQFAAAAWDAGFRAIGVAKTFVHMDVRENPSGGSDFWTYGDVKVTLADVMKYTLDSSVPY